MCLGHTDDDRFAETSIQIRQAQGTFPSAFNTAVYLLVDLLEDEDTIDKGATGSFRDYSTMKKISFSSIFQSLKLLEKLFGQLWSMNLPY